jgi:hypothetical protein
MKHHDFTQGGWGHHFSVWETLPPDTDPTIAPGTRYYGHAVGLKKDDIVLLAMQSGKVARWRINEIEYKRDPHDMFFARASLVGYVGEPDIVAEAP